MGTGSEELAQRHCARARPWPPPPPGAIPRFYNRGMAPVLDVCIRGAGIVGRTLALLLASERLRVGLAGNPAPSADAGDIRAYALNAASRRLLEDLRAWPDRAFATPVLAMEVHGDDGGQVRFDAGELGSPALAWIVEAQALQDGLAQACRFQPQITALEGPQGAALTAVCEGKHSTTRADFGASFQVTPYPQTAIATRLHCEKPHGGIARQWFSPGEILAFLPLGGEGGNSVAVVWSVAQERAAALLALDAADFESALAAASHERLGRLVLAGERAAWPLQLALADRWCGPGWVLAGDAAHTVHPLAGQGLNLGLADARELARVLAQREYWRSPGDERLLRRYERARKADVLAMGLATDGLQQLFSRPESGWALARNWGMKGFERSGPLKQWAARQAAGRL